MDNIIKRAPIPLDARIKRYYDTKEILQNETTLNFFPANATKTVYRDNYINNPFPGDEVRRVVGLSFELVKQFIRLDTANNILPQRIINAVKDAGFVLTADNNYKEFLRSTLAQYFNFKGTGLVGQTSSAYIDSAVDTDTMESVIVKSSGMQALSDPFDIAPNQSMTLTVTFADASDFPSAANWDATTQGRLYLRATMYLAELEPGEG